MSDVNLLYLPMCAEPETQETECATQQENVVGSYELAQQKLKQANETIAELTEEVSRLQQTTSEMFTVLSAPEYFV